MSDPLLEIRGLRVSFLRYERGLRRRILEPVTAMDLTVHPGEFIALVGGSGAGKTLLAHAVLGLLPANARRHGTIRFRGTELDDAACRRLAGRQVALLPQSVSFLDPLQTVGTQIHRAATLAGRREPDLVDTELTRRHLDVDLARAHAHQLSGGQARRVLDILASLGDPDLLFADEPTPGLEDHAVRAVLDRLRARADRGRAVVLITHDLAAAVRFADRVVVCRTGTTIASEPATAFHGDGADIAHPYARALWRALPANGLHTDPPGERS